VTATSTTNNPILTQHSAAWVSVGVSWSMHGRCMITNIASISAQCSMNVTSPMKTIVFPHCLLRSPSRHLPLCPFPSLYRIHAVNGVVSNRHLPSLSPTCFLPHAISPRIVSPSITSTQCSVNLIDIYGIFGYPTPS
jgi:hypothetical protein